MTQPPKAPCTSTNHGPPSHRPQVSTQPPQADTVLLKRRQNTIASRKFRQRKLKYVESLEQQVEELTRETNELKRAAASLEERVFLLREMIDYNAENPGTRARAREGGTSQSNVRL